MDVNVQQPQFLTLGLVGYPLGNSLSPLIHETLIGLSGLQGTYRLFPVSPSCFYDANTPETVGFSGVLAQHPSLTGFNITLPYKVEAYHWVTQRTPQAEHIQAVNTVKRLTEGSFIGHNTDGIGFYKALPEAVKATLHQRHTFVLGAGGACRAVLEALFFAKPSVGNITLVVRNLEKAEPLVSLAVEWASEVGAAFNVITFEALTPAQLALCGLMINTTPVGMFPDAEYSPLSVAQLQHLPATCFVTDLVYKPAETLLLKNAKAQGLAGQNGLGMLIHQALEAFSFWTSQPIEPQWFSAVQAKITAALAH
jgi:shikimate dehydrogenase